MNNKSNSGLFKKGQTPWNRGLKNQYPNPRKGKKCPEISKRLLGHHVSDESKIKMSLARIGKKLSVETRTRMSNAHKGRIAWNKGIKCPQISKSVAGIPRPYTRGEKSGSWKGGITSINLKIRNSLEYLLWRKSCFERDGFKCQRTGQIGGKLVVHHINNFADFPELRLAIDNGITFTKDAHKDFHRIYGKKNNTKEQLAEFLSIKVK